MAEQPAPEVASDVPDFDPTRSDWDLSLGILLAAAHTHSLITSHELSPDGSHLDSSSIILLGKVHLPSEFHGTNLEVDIIRSLDPPVDKQLGQGIGRVTFQKFATSPPLLFLGARLPEQAFEAVLRAVRHAAQNPRFGLSVDARVKGIDRKWTRSGFLMVQRLEIKVEGQFGSDQDVTVDKERRATELQQLGTHVDVALKANAAEINSWLNGIAILVNTFGVSLAILLALILWRIW